MALVLALDAEFNMDNGGQRVFIGLRTDEKMEKIPIGELMPYDTLVRYVGFVDELGTVVSIRPVSDVWKEFCQNLIARLGPKGAVAEEPAALEFIEEQSDDVVHTALSQDPKTLRFVRHQTELLCLDVVKRQPSCLKLVNHQTPEICEAALAKDPSSIRYIQNLSLDHLEFVMDHHDPSKLRMLLAWIRRQQTPELVAAAVKRVPKTAYFIRTAKKELVQAAIDSNFKCVRYMFSPQRFG